MACGCIESLKEVDATGTLCPIPLIRAQDFVRSVKPGDKFALLANDPGVHQDIPAWCRMHGHEIVSTSENCHVIRMVIRTAGADSS